MRPLTMLFVMLATSAMFAQDESFDSDGVRIHYYDRGGDGQPVVLAHGGFEDRTIWEELGTTTALSNAGYRVIALDMRGYGRSEKPHDHRQYGYEMSHDIARLLDHLSITKAHVIGYSQGAIVANRFRAKHPHRVITVTLAGNAAQSKDSVWVQHANEFADAVLKGDLAPIVHTLTPPDQDPWTHEQITDLYRTLSSNNDMRAAAASTRAQGFPDRADELRTNKTPALVVIGEKDPNRKNVDWTAQTMANTKVVVIPGAGHNDALKHPMFIKEVLGFLSKQRE